MLWLKTEARQRRGSNPASFPCMSHLELGSDKVPEFQFEHPSDLICAMGIKNAPLLSRYLQQGSPWTLFSKDKLVSLEVGVPMLRTGQTQLSSDDQPY